MARPVQAQESEDGELIEDGEEQEHQDVLNKSRRSLPLSTDDYIKSEWNDLFFEEYFT